MAEGFTVAGLPGGLLCILPSRLSGVRRAGGDCAQVDRWRVCTHGVLEECCLSARTQRLA